MRAKDIWAVAHFMDDNGNLFQHSGFCVKFHLQCTVQNYNRLVKAIPISLKTKIKQDILYSEFSPAMQQLCIEDIFCDNKCFILFIYFSSTSSQNESGEFQNFIWNISNQWFLKFEVSGLKCRAGYRPRRLIFHSAGDQIWGFHLHNLLWSRSFFIHRCKLFIPLEEWAKTLQYKPLKLIYRPEVHCTARGLCSATAGKPLMTYCPPVDSSKTIRLLHYTAKH